MPSQFPGPQVVWAQTLDHDDSERAAPHTMSAMGAVEAAP